MTISRRLFLKNMAALAAVPAIVKAENLMNIWVPPEKEIILGGDLAIPGSDLNQFWTWGSGKTLCYIGPPDRAATVTELYEWVRAYPPKSV